MIVVLGPTASGKSAYAVTLAHSLGNAEIINADSRQLYRGMNIGTAKVTQEEMQGVPHHMIDVLDPTEKSTAGWYKKEAEKVIDDILMRGKMPILVGGSMLYIAAITDGLSFDPEKRDELRSVTSESKYSLDIRGLGSNRDEVVAKINYRTKKMFESGFIDEVRSLLREGYTKEDPAFVACGYREIAEALASGDVDEKALDETIAAKTRQYARRQMTWWRGDSRIRWL